MGKPKNKWSTEEEAALIAGVKKYGIGKWKRILEDNEFAPHLFNRTNIDLKDKWRNYNISYSVVLPQSSQNKPTSRTIRRIGGMVTSRRLCHVVILIIAIVIMYGHGIQTQTRWKLPPSLTVLKLVWPHIYHVIPKEFAKRWRELERFQRGVRRFCKWVETVNKHVKLYKVV